MPPSPMTRPERPLDWPAAVAQALRAGLPGVAIELVDQIDSTNSELMRRARAGLAVSTLLVARTQSAGRGRLGRTWLSAPSAAAPVALTASLALPLAPQDWSGLSLAVGLALAQSLHPALQLKWPNDLWWQDHKLGGVLIETAATPSLAAPARWVVMGYGLNLTAPTPDPSWATPAAGLHALLPGLSAWDALVRTAPAVWQAAQAFVSQGFAPLQAAYGRRDALRGRDVTLSDGRWGRCEGVDADGALRVRSADALLRVSSAEVSVRVATATGPAC